MFSCHQTSVVFFFCLCVFLSACTKIFPIVLTIPQLSAVYFTGYTFARNMMVRRLFSTLANITIHSIGLRRSTVVFLTIEHFINLRNPTKSRERFKGFVFFFFFCVITRKRERAKNNKNLRNTY